MLKWIAILGMTLFFAGCGNEVGENRHDINVVGVNQIQESLEDAERVQDESNNVVDAVAINEDQEAQNGFQDGGAPVESNSSVASAIEYVSEDGRGFEE